MFGIPEFLMKELKNEISNLGKVVQIGPIRMELTSPIRKETDMLKRFLGGK